MSDYPVLGVIIVRYEWPTTHKWHKAIMGEWGMRPECDDRIRMNNAGAMHFNSLKPAALPDFERDNLDFEVCGRCFGAERKARRARERANR